MERSPWKLFSAFYPRSQRFSSRSLFFSMGCMTASRSTRRFLPLAGASRDERGFLLVALPVLLSLLFLFLMGSLRVAAKEQAEVALQARLDICAVRLAASREALYSRLARLNQALEATKLGIYAARGLAVLGPGAVVAAASEPALCQANAAFALAQNAMLTQAAAKELGELRCAPTPFSRETALCFAAPVADAGLERERTLFPDVKGPLRAKKKGDLLVRIRCSGMGRAATKLAVKGDSNLLRGPFRDEYEK